MHASPETKNGEGYKLEIREEMSDLPRLVEADVAGFEVAERPVYGTHADEVCALVVHNDSPRRKDTGYLSYGLVRGSE
jgi:hypothetical protein